MIWLLTQRQVVYHIYKKRWRKRASESQQAYWRRHNLGIRMNDFEAELFNEEFSGKGIIHFFKYIYTSLRPNYLQTFLSRLNDIIRQCIADGYIIEKNGRLLVQSNGEKFISRWYYIVVFFKNRYIEYLVIAILSVWVGKILLPELTSLYKVLFLNNNPLN